MSKQKTKGCKCFDQVNEQLKPDGMCLESALQIDFKSGKATMAGPFLFVKWIDKPKRGKKLPLITCAFCPMCGKKK